ncbi:MAG: hypothetical protein KAW89_06685 [Armatimonadetes bacterium]|nr:hypothetical protein [Armatimonadota bacterium]
MTLMRRIKKSMQAPRPVLLILTWRQLAQSVEIAGQVPLGGPGNNRSPALKLGCQPIDLEQVGPPLTAISSLGRDEIIPW